MRYDTTLNLIHFLLMMLINDPDNATSNQLADLIRLKDEIAIISPPIVLESNREPYKTYSLACGVLMLDEFNESVPRSDSEIKTELQFIKGRLNAISHATWKKKISRSRTEARAPSIVRGTD